MSQIYRFCAYFNILLLAVGCKSDCGSPPPVPAISFNSPVTEGDYLVLTARGADDLDYKWTSPEGETHEGKVWEYGTVQRINSGFFLVTASEGDCDGITNSTEVEVLYKNLPCVPGQNSVLFSNGSITTLTDNAVSCRVNQENKFEISINGQEGSFTIEFPDENAPALARSYGVKGNPDYLIEDIVNVELFVSNESMTYKARTSGFVYIRFTSFNSFEIYTCDLPLYGESSVINATIRVECII